MRFSGACGLEGQDQDGDVAVLEAFDEVLPGPDGRASVQELARHPARRQVPSQQSSHRGEVGEHEGTAALRQVRVDQLVEQTDLVGTAGERGVLLAEVLGGVIADLLQTGQQRHDAAAPPDALARLDPLHGVADERLVHAGLLRGERDVEVDLRLRWKLGGDPRIRLPAPEHER